jgi:hypothetical protein
MSLLTVSHLTVYRYSKPVGLGAHRMMFRPRESHDLKLIRTSLRITPTPTRLRWLHDVFDNSIAIAEFEGLTSELRFESIVTLQHFETPCNISKPLCRNTLWRSTRTPTHSAIRMRISPTLRVR